MASYKPEERLTAAHHEVVGKAVQQAKAGFGRRLIPLVVLFAIPLAAATKPPVVAFGKPLPVKMFVGPADEQSLDMQVRPLHIRGQLREFTTGEPHDVTDRLFVVRRAYRINDRLPEDEKKAPRWRWQRGGWLLVDRLSGRVQSLSLPDFDPFYSVVSWYRDYAAYCGISDDGDKLFAVVAQVGRRKPLLHRQLGIPQQREAPDSECAEPRWERAPARVTFQPTGSQPVTFEVRGHAADLAPPAPSEE